MCRFIETLCILNGRIRNIDYHQERFETTRKKFFPHAREIDLQNEIDQKKYITSKKIKCRVLYGNIVENIEFLPYRIKVVKSFKLLERPYLSYEYKYANRHTFEALKKGVKADEIIFLQNEEITDTTYSNLIFYNGADWITPSNYLLKGTMRQCLIDNDKIKEDCIEAKDLSRFSSFKMINAMMNIEESPEYPISKILTD